MLATWELASAVETLRTDRSRSGDRLRSANRAIAQMRQALDKLPEIRHPLDR